MEFDNYMQQDAHEFLNFLINHINETIVGKEQFSNAFTFRAAYLGQGNREDLIRVPYL